MHCETIRQPNIWRSSINTYMSKCSMKYNKPESSEGGSNPRGPREALPHCPMELGARGLDGPHCQGRGSHCALGSTQPFPPCASLMGRKLEANILFCVEFPGPGLRADKVWHMPGAISGSQRCKRCPSEKVGQLSIMQIFEFPGGRFTLRMGTSPGGPVVKTPCFCSQSRGPRFDP